MGVPCQRLMPPAFGVTSGTSLGTRAHRGVLLLAHVFGWGDSSRLALRPNCSGTPLLYLYRCPHFVIRRFRQRRTPACRFLRARVAGEPVGKPLPEMGKGAPGRLCYENQNLLVFAHSGIAR